MNSSEVGPEAAAVPPLGKDGASPTAAPSSEKQLVNRLLLFFGLVYVVEGLGQIGGLIAQPLTYFLKEMHGWNALQVTAFITVFNVPWVIKPVYGLFSDFLPLFGYRRKSYLVIANVAAVAGYAWATQINVPGLLLLALMLTAYAMAISSTLCGAVLVENGQELGQSGRFVNQQWLWFNVAAMAAAIIGGQLVQRLSPGSALHVAAGIVAVAPFAVILGTVSLIPERKVSIDMQGMRRTLDGLLSSFKRRELWIIAVFIFLYYFSPGFATPLYYHMTDKLKFSQAYIGILGSIASAGWVLGALFYRRFFSDLSLKTLLNVSIAFGTATTVAYLLLSTEASAAILNFCSGFAAMLATVGTLTLAADHCPQRAEGFAFAVLMSIINLSTASADNIGSFLYIHVFNNSLTPLVLVSAASTAFAFVLVPLLRLGGKRQGEPALAAGRGESSRR
ncbi:MAG: MFS transporter [Xanthobacteraceae bacterium]